MVARERANALLVAAVLGAALGGGCKGGEREPAATEDPEQIERVVGRVLEAQGGEKGVAREASYRAEGTVVLVPEHEVGDVVRWVDPGGRVRTELRFKDRGEVAITAGDTVWTGPDDRSLVARPATLPERLARESTRRDAPLVLLDRASSLSLLVPEKEHALFLYSTTPDSLAVDYRIDPKNHRITELSLSSDASPDVTYRVELEAYRWVKGTLFPFKEVHFLRDRKQMEIRFRKVTLSPEIPAPLFPQDSS